jgi:hypothetical protein
MEENGLHHYTFLCRDHFLPTGLFLKYDVHFESEHLDIQLPVIAKWEHIQKIYEQEKHFRIRTLYKMTDDHLAPVTQWDMKVSLAVQVISHTDPLENTFGVIRLHCGSNNNPIVGQFVVALKTSIINGLAYAGLRNANSKGDDTELLDNLHSLLRESSASRLNPSTSQGRETIHDGLCGFHIAEQVQQEVNDVEMDLFSVAYVSGFIAKRVVRAVRCDNYKTCLTSPMMLSTNALK